MEKYINKSYSTIEKRKSFLERFNWFLTRKIDFENMIFAIFERPEGVGRSFYQKTIRLQVI